MQRVVTETDREPQLRWIVAPTVLAIAIWCAFDYWTARPDPDWDGSGVTGLSWYAVCLLLLTWIVSRITRPRLRFARALSIATAPLPLVVLAIVAILAWAPPVLWPWIYVALALGAFVYLGIRLRRLGVARLVPAVVSACVVSLALGCASQQFYVPTSLWYPPEEEETDTASETYTDAERILFEQPKQIDAAVDKVAPSSGDRPLLYFVGFAGDGEQHVFAAEAEFAAKVVAARYGTAARTLLLVNDTKERREYPLATLSGLRRALRAIATRMDVSRDAVLLFLTSHGSDEPELSVQNRDLPLQQLSATALGEALDESGIQWRVVVISACYSGAFIAPLRDDRTIVLTAAAADRTSFGCGDDRELTYFGEALFRDALPTAPSLLTAFETARQAIEAREKQEGMQPSLPQAYLGDAMVERWRTIEAAATTSKP